MARVLLIAPNWDNQANVASRRLHDLRRWLESAGHDCRVVGSEGQGDGLLVVDDPLRLRGELRAAPSGPGSRAARWWRDLRHLPDPGIVWARRVSSHPQAREWAAESDLVLSSSPPESTHLAALALADTSPGTRLWIDLQDGWIDDPLRRVLEEFPLRRWLEARQERRVLARASTVSVTTAAWARMLVARHRGLQGRLLELPLAPPSLTMPPSRPELADGRIRLLHAGTFTLSHHRRRMELLLDPLLRAARDAEAGQPRAHVLLLGRLHPVEESQLPAWRERFAGCDWRLEASPGVARESYFEMMARQHGLLLLSASRGALPSKLFEYLQLGRPILALAPRSSAVWEQGENSEAMHRVALDEAPDRSAILRFLQDAASRGEPYAAPRELGEDALRQRFLARVEATLSDR